jgi:Bacterial extracellular solute-binding protein
MRPTKLSTLACAAGLAAVPLAACGSSSNSGSSAHPTITYWASNQGTSLQDDRQVLGPQIAKFTKETGIKVNFQVIPWTTLLNQITAATVSGKGPDVLNIGNTWSASLQATGAFVPFTSSVMNQIGGSSRFLARQPLGYRGARQATDGRPALQPRLRPVLQQGSVRRSRYQRAAHHMGPVRRRRQEAHEERALGTDP